MNLKSKSNPTDRNVQVFDVKNITERLGDDKEIIKLLINGYLEETPIQFEALKKAIKELDFKIIERQAHTIKGGAADIGGNYVRERALKIENAGRDGNLELVNEHFPKLAEEVEQLINTVIGFLNDENNELAD